MKVLKSGHISPFGGLNFVLKEFSELKIDQLLKSYLPDLPNQTFYDWKDLLFSFWSIYFCGGDCIEDVGINLKEHLKRNPFVRVPSPDRILDRFKELSKNKEVFTVPRGKSKHEFGINNPLNKLNLKILKSIGLTSKNNLVLDYDNTVIFTNKADAKVSYKFKHGYCPGVGIIGNKIVFIENRNGNSDAKTLQFDTLQRMFNLLKGQKIKIDAFRADGASYQFKVIDLISKHSNKLYMRANMSDALAREIAKISDWEEINLGSEKAYRGEIKFTPFIRTAKRSKEEHLLKEYRLIVTKLKRSDKQVNLFTGEACNYSSIITNDQQKSKHEIAQFYNDRGAIEKQFDVLKNDFGWNNLPFSKLEQNTVFLIFTAICRNLYDFIIKKFSDQFKNLNPNFRIKKFIYRFISIPAKWIYQARQRKLRIYGSIAFKT